MSKNRKLIMLIVSLVVITSLISCAVAGSMFYFIGLNDKRTQSIFDPKKVSKEGLAKFSQAKTILEDGYFEKVDENKLLEGSIAGMAESLKDPYTVYFSKEQMKIFTDMTDKSQDTYVGIGVSVSIDANGILTVLEPFEDSPALNAGIIGGDKILSVDGNDVTTIRDEQLIVNKIKGPEGTDVKLKIYRPSEGKNIDFTIKRKKLTIVINIKSDVIENQIGYIKLAMFDADIYNNFKKELDKLLLKKIKGLVVDLRNNPGGSYQEVVRMVDLFLPKALIVYTEDRNKKVEKEYSDENEVNLPLVVLVNENSASASEIFAGAIKDNKKGTIIGTKTFGKGLVQAVKYFEDGTGMKYTISRYYTPSGVCIHGIGIMPDIEVKNDKQFESTPISMIPKDKDEQLKKALETIKTKMK